MFAAGLLLAALGLMLAFVNPLAAALTLAANLADIVESDTRARTGAVTAGLSMASWSPAQPRRVRAFALWAALAAFALSLCEWWSYHRRWTV